MQREAKFWDKIAPGYAKKPISDVASYEKMMDRVRSYLKATDRVLELGCGTGSTAILLAPLADSYIAGDISGGMLEIGEEKRVAAGVDNLSFRQGATDAFAGERFDVVMGFNLFHLVTDMEADFALIRDMLPEGGLFIQKSPALGRRWYLKPVIAAMRLIGKAPQVRFFGSEELDRAVEAAGFEIIETDTIPPTGPSRFIVARKR